MDVQRVMEVWDPAGQIAGTGYLITNRLVMTAYHNIQHAGSTSQRAVEVRQLTLYGQQPAAWVDAEVLWPEQPPDIEQDPHTDAALLLIADPAWQPPVSAAPVRGGRLPLPGAVEARVACVAVGFPEAEQRDGKRDTKHISGHIETLSGLKSGLITAHIDQVATPNSTGATSSWSGASGAALFCGNLLTGVLTTDRAGQYPGNQLIAVPLATLAARPGFTTTIKAAGEPLVLEEIITTRRLEHLGRRRAPRREAYTALSNEFRKFHRAMGSCRERANAGDVQGAEAALPSYPEGTDRFEMAITAVQLEGPRKVAQSALEVFESCVRWYGEMREWISLLRGESDGVTESNWPFLVEVAEMESERKFSEFMDVASDGLNEDDSDPGSALD
ncbi:trypsin-like serine protease [Streptomyces sp. R35]|uniref:Trypsin-like serine protease n=1 Tax=Streptomyces sp. R35 TaxID=3238630 RepID=A0AB39SCU5_9ACTN